jgi:hypothetical protein
VELPRLAWCLQFDPGRGIVEVDHGPWVEISDTAFYEGAWAGPLDRLRFDEASTFAGSGAVLRDGNLVVVSASDTNEGVYSVTSRDGRVFFSNSIAFVLQASGEGLDPSYMDYENAFLSLADGLDRYRRELPTASGNPFRQHFFCNIRITPTGEIQEFPKSIPNDPIRSYEEYLTFLRSQIKSLCENAASPARSHRYSPIAFCSTGYDSPACAALARELGCDEAVVFETKKSSLRSDSGVEIVKRLGYTNIVELNELDYRRYDMADLFVATGELGNSIFSAPQPSS